MNVVGNHYIIVFYFVKLIVSLSCIGIAVFIYKYKNKGIFFPLSLNFGLEAFLNASLNFIAYFYGYVAENLITAYTILGAFNPILLIHFCLSFPEYPKKFNKKLLPFMYLPVLFFIYQSLTKGYYSNIRVIAKVIIVEKTWPFVLYAFCSLIAFIVGTAIIRFKLKNSSNHIIKNQLRILLNGLYVSGIFLIIGLILTYFKIYVYLYEIGTLILFFCISYAIIKYKMFDIRTAIHYSIVWAIFFVIAILPLIAIPFILNKSFQKIGMTNALIIIGFISIGYYAFAQRFIFPGIGRVLLRKNRKLTQTVEGVRKGIEGCSSIEAVQKNFGEIADSHLYASWTEVLLGPDFDKYSRPRSSRLKNIGSSALQWLENRDDCLDKKALINSAGSQITIPIELGLVFPLIQGQKRLGMVLLGEKRNFKPYDYEDITFLKKIVGTVANTVIRILETERATEIELLSNMKTNLFVNLAHETKTPLSIIQANLESYVKEAPESEKLNEIKYNIDLLIKDMVNFLDVEKISQGKILYDDAQGLNVSEIVNMKVLSFKDLCSQKNILIEKHIEDDVCIYSDPFAFDRILNNLIDNAVKYNKKGGEISVKVWKDENMAFIEISDTGIGIEQEHIKRIFEPYYQVAHKKNNAQGMGMGLYITKKIVESLNGTIRMESVLGEFTSIRIRIPEWEHQNKALPKQGLIYDMPMEMPVYDIGDVYKENGKALVLIVEDNIRLLAALRSELSKEYSVVCSLNGIQALQKINQEPIPDIIVSDIMMDVMDGYELLEQVRKSEIARDIPFVFLTAKVGINEEIKGLKSGAVDYIQKPFSMEALKARINSLVEYNLLKKKSFQLEKYRSIGMMTASISHEILNPLSGITGPLYILEKELKAIGNKNGEAVNIALEHIKKNVGRIDNIVTTLKDLFHGDDLKLEPFQLIETIEPIIRMFQEKVGKTIIIEEEIPRDFHIYSNKSAITQIVINLITNSIDAITSNKGLIRVIARIEDGEKCIQVTDNGVGIDPLNMDKIFNLNFTTKQKGQGTGMGLYIVKELTNKLNLAISVDSVLNKGSTFTIRET